MNQESKNKGIVVLCAMIALLAAVASAAGVFLRGDGATASTTSILGEHYEYATSGVYRYNPERMVAEGVGWDLVTLFVVVPAMLLLLPLLRRGSLRGRLAAIGLLGYFFYQYLMYALMWAFGPLFVLFVVLYSASLWAGAWVVSTIPLAHLKERFSERFPHQGMAILSIGFAVLLLLMWSARIASGLSGDLAGAMLLGQPTMIVQALDLGLLVPLSVLTAVMLWQRRPVGYLLSTALAVKATVMALAISAMLLVAWRVEGELEVAPLLIFALATLASLWLGIRMFRSIKTPREA